MLRLKYKKTKIILMLIIMFFGLSFSYSYVSNKTKIAKIIIKIVLKNIDSLKDDIGINISIDKVGLPNYNNYFVYLFNFFNKDSYKNRLNNIKPFKYILTDYIVGLHYREHGNNISSNPYNGDGIFQIYRIGRNLRGNQHIYFTPPNMYNQIYKTCMGGKSCKDFTNNSIYEYGDFAGYIYHKFNYMNIANKSIYGTYYNGRRIKGLNQILANKMNIYVDDGLWKLFIKSYNNYLNTHNLKIDNLLKINFKFINNSYNISDYNDFIDLLYNKYGFKAYGVSKNFIKTLLDTFQLSVIGAYYNGLGNVQGSWIYMGYTFNFPMSFTQKLGGIVKPKVFKKVSGRGYMVNDAQVGSVVYYYYVKQSSDFNNIILMRKILF